MFILATLPLLSLVLGQTDDPVSRPFVSALDLEVIQANFQGAQLVPELLPTFTPQGVVSPHFVDILQPDYLPIGQLLNQSDVTKGPGLLVQVGPNSTDLSSNTTLFTIIMVDAGPVGTDQAKQRVHWLENGVFLQGIGMPSSNPPVQFINNNATIIVKYVPPAPTAGSGPHRYVILAYLQPPTFSPQSNITDPGNFSLSQYVSSSGLGAPVVATYFQVQNGTTTTTPIPTTTSVVTSTLAQASTYLLSLTTTAGSVVTVTPTSAAGRKESFILGGVKGVMVGCVGVLGTVLGAGLVL